MTASSDAAPREAVEDESSSSCVVSGAWGSYRTMLNATRVTKVDYAKRWGYRYLEYAHASVDGFAADCGDGCASCGQAVADLAVGKFCAVKRAFASGCESVLWIDADNAIFDHSRNMTSLAPQAKSDRRPWAVWGYQTGAAHPDAGDSAAACDSLAAAGECGDAASDFGECLNSGVFVMRAGARASRAIDAMLGVDPTSLPVDDAVWNWQCRKDGAYSYNDQCALAYYTATALATTAGYRCLAATDELEVPSRRPLQNYATSYFAPANLTIDTEAFVNACVWGTTAEKRACVEVMMLEWASSRRSRQS